MVKITKKILESLPQTPGVYIFRYKKRKILYIGKAAKLKDRISSYFSTSTNLTPKIINMISRIEKIDFIETKNEAEALILESELIKRNKPPYNTEWKDEKNFLYVKISSEKFPQILLVRYPLDDKSIYYGPFIDATALRKTLKFLRKIFPYRDETCQINSGKPCFYYHLGMCPGTCISIISEKDYNKNIKNINLFFQGKLKSLDRNLEKEMYHLTKKQKFEKAAKIRDQLQNLKQITKVKFFEEKNFKQDKALFGLSKALKIKIPKRIECFDISNITGTGATGSMVVFELGLPKRLDYRRFKIKTVKKIDDYAMMGEVIRRRFSKIDQKKDESFAKLADLVIIDGGQGHLNAVLKVFAELQIDIPVCALAKKQEELYKVKSEKLKVKNKKVSRFEKIFLPKDSETLFLIQRIRDEAHRFAIIYHHLIRKKELKKSILDSISGIGPKTRTKLLIKFGSVAGIKKASLEDLKMVVSSKLAKNIKESIR